MPLSPDLHRLSVEDVELILAVTSKLAAPFDLNTMLAEVVEAAKQVVKVERGSVWLYDSETDEMVLETATGLAPVRIPAGSGFVGACARERRLINVPDCYADPRFNQDIDRASGYRTRCMLTLPLVDHEDVLVGAMQLLNKIDGTFDEDDEALATALAAQCAVALQRVRMTEALIDGEKMRRELEMARVVQMSTLPATMPAVPGYDVYGTFEPAELTGGDTFDLSLVGEELLVVLADATGHGIAPALSVTQMQAMFRLAFRLGIGLEKAVVQVNNELAGWLADDRFITAFVGLLDPAAHRLRFHSAGQAPILHFNGASGECTLHKPTSFPLGAMRVSSLRPAVEIDMQPGDALVLLSDGIYEYERPDGEQFGVDRVREIVAADRWAPASDVAATLLQSVRNFAHGAAQQDDITVVLVKREFAGHVHALFPRSNDALASIVSFTESFFERESVDARLRLHVDFAIEELFTNMVKYGRSSADVGLDIKTIADGVEVAITDYDVERFDVTRSPDADVELPIERRNVGGLGLHLVRRVVDSIDYSYSEHSRRSRIVFRKTLAGVERTGKQPRGSGAEN